MLTDWYFCSCVGADASKSFTYLSILDSIKDTSSTFQYLEQAIQELSLTETWVQIYAIPYVLDLLYREDLPVEVSILVKNYCVDTLNFLPSGFPKKDIIELINLIVSKDTSQKIFSLVAASARQVRELPSRTKTEMPYLDLRLFFPETLLLCILNFINFTF